MSITDGQVVLRVARDPGAGACVECVRVRVQVCACVHVPGPSWRLRGTRSLSLAHLPAPLPATPLACLPACLQ